MYRGGKTFTESYTMGDSSFTTFVSQMADSKPILHVFAAIISLYKIKWGVTERSVIKGKLIAEKAIELLTAALELIPEDRSLKLGVADIHLIKGNLLINSGEVDSAMAEYLKSTDIDPTHFKALCNQAMILSDQGDYPNAMRLLNKAIQINPGFVAGIVNRGNVYFYMHREVEALRDYNQAIETDPNYSRAYANRGDVYLKWGENKKALSDYNKAIELNPEIGGVYSSRAAVYQRLGQLEDSISDFTFALSNYANEVELILVARGSSHDRLGNNPKALKDYSIAIELDPELEIAYLARGTLYLKLKAKSKALEDLTKYDSFVDGKNPFVQNAIKDLKKQLRLK